MKTKLSFILCFTVCCFFMSNGQDSSMLIGKDPVTIRNLYNTTFSGIVTGQAFSSVGNFASVEINEPKVSFAASIVFKNASVLAINGKGGISDNVLSLFTNSKFNSQFEIGAQYEMPLFLKRNKMWFDDESYREYLGKKIQMVQDFKKDSFEFRHQKAERFVEKQDNALVKSLSSKRKEYTRINDSLSNIITKIELTLKEGVNPTSLLKTKTDLVSVRDSIKFMIFKDSVDLAANLSRKSFGLINSRALRNDLENKFNQDTAKLKYGIKLFNVCYHWFSFGYHIKTAQFKLFDPNTSYNQQVVKQSGISHEVKVAFSSFRWTDEKFKSHYYNGGASFTYGDNLDELDPVEITDITNYGPNPNDRTSSKKYTAYRGSYKTYLKGIRLFAEYYHFFFNENAVAFHAYTNYKIKDKVQPTLDHGLGIMFSVKNPEKESVIVNVEIYYTFKDVFNALDSDKKFWERNDIGIRFGFPIKYHLN